MLILDQIASFIGPKLFHRIDFLELFLATEMQESNWKFEWK